MQIEVGKRYVRRDGSVSGVIVSRESIDYPFRDIASGHTLTSSGRVYYETALSDFDLVAEYVEPVSPSEISGKESAVEYDLSGIPAGYSFVGYRLVQVGDQYVGNVGGTKVFVATESDVAMRKLRLIVKPIAPPEPKQRTVVIHTWLAWDSLGKERVVTGTKKYVDSCGFQNVIDLGRYEEVKVNV